MIRIAAPIRSFALVALTLFTTATQAADSGTAASAQLDSTIAGILNSGDGNYQTRINEYIASSLNKRFSFLDVSYLSPDDNGGKSGWKTSYNWNPKRSGGNGFEVVNQQALLKTFSMELDVQGTYSYGTATNNEDYANASFKFGVERGNFGTVRYVERATSQEYENCLAALDITSPQYAAGQQLCIDRYNIRDVVSGGGPSSFWSWKGHGGIEGDQNYRLKNSTYGTSAYYSRSRLPTFGFILERVDPTDNEQRKTLAGNDDDFDRASLELAFKQDLSEVVGYPVWFYMSYRYFHELSPPQAIKNAGMDNFDYVSASLRFSAAALSEFIKTDDTMLYVRYTQGQLPFDQQSDSAVEVGFSTDISALANLFQK